MKSIKINGLKEYKAAFDGKEPQIILEKAIATRNFEIEMYWKRTTYYWTINAAIFAAYFLLINRSSSTEVSYTSIAFAVNSLGFIFSLAWYLTNKASKFWQVNWEKHIEMLEDEVIGPLFKTTLQFEEYATFSRFIFPNQPFPFSVSKINSILSLFVFCIWAIFWVSFVCHTFILDFDKLFSINTFIFLATIVAFFSFFIFGQTGIKKWLWKYTNRHNESKVNFQIRGIEEPDPPQSVDSLVYPPPAN